MTNLDSHRKVVAESMKILTLQPPFSFFDFAEDTFEASESIRRIFSLARSSKARTLVCEKIPPVGIILEENEDLIQQYPRYKFSGLFRLSFWGKDSLKEEEIDSLTDEDCIGYAIFKKDEVGSRIDGWHVFEAVFPKYPHEHNCIPRPQTYFFNVGNRPSKISGVLYCQQNGFNKTCAQVALRSLLSRLLPEGDISYRKLNEIAKKADPTYTIGRGLHPFHIEKILEEFGLRYHDIDYSTLPNASRVKRRAKKKLRIDSPYQKFAYAGLESGGGALVGFTFTNASGKRSGHIIPVFGHTFNKDNWAPDANFSYFKIGKAEYLPSEIWTSSFIAHDDNFGPNLCIPRFYVQHERVDYVLEVFRPGIKYSGIQAEAIALNIFNMIIKRVNALDNRWIHRLQFHNHINRLVFRALGLSRQEYINHLQTIKDWQGNAESEDICSFLKEELPDLMDPQKRITPLGTRSGRFDSLRGGMPRIVLLDSPVVVKFAL